MQKTLRCCVQEHRGVARVELAVGHDLIKLLHALRFHVNHVVHLGAVIHVPEVYPEVIG